jgi:hypothetical protein
MSEICQQDLPYRPWSDPRLSRLPGLVPVAPGEWLQIDEAYGAQMRRRAEVLADAGAAVLASAPGSLEALDELLVLVLRELSTRADFTLAGDLVTCPDGRVVDITGAPPLEVLNALVQEDFCLLQKPAGADEHVLTAALLCFPASWSLAQKFMRPLIGIHDPVDSYDDNIARRVQRLFDGIRVGQPIWRANVLAYEDPELFQPATEEARRAKPDPHGRLWLRSERQTLVKLEKTGAVVFSIHTYVVPLERFGEEGRRALLARG